MKAKSIRYLRKQRKAFCQLSHIDELAQLLSFPAHRLQLLSLQPAYHLFSRPKADGSLRWIEDPEGSLKKIQRSLNFYLQSVYFFMASEAAYGFLISAKKDPNPRNILTNAQQHLGCQWLYNVDIEDFFHQIKFEKVYQLFVQPPFEFEEELALLLARLCTFKERLPMGAPTSPILSNFVCQEMDKQLLALAKWTEWTYTRFADDMSFSSFNEIKAAGQQKIEAIVAEHHYRLNPAKSKLMKPEDPKVVTGLLLEEQVKLPAGFAADLNKEIEKLGHVLEAKARTHKRSKWVETYQAKVEGMLNFAAFIMGDDHPIVLEADAQLEQALNPPDKHGAMSWLEFGYF